MKRVGIREIAKLANVSPGTVDRALHGRKGITEETRRRVLAIAESVGYSPDLAARALSVGRAPVQIGVCIPREIRYYFEYLLQGILTEARRFEQLGVQVLYSPAERLGSEVVELVSELLDRSVDALIVTPGNPQALTPVIDEAESKGIRVICVDTDAPSSKRSTVVRIDAEVCGSLAAELMAGFLPPRSEVVVITGMREVEDHARKVEGFRRMNAENGSAANNLEVIEAHEDEEESFQKCFALLSKRSSVAGLYVNTVNCLPVCRAICALGLSGKIRLITTDLFHSMVPYFEKGTISASIHGRPFVQGEMAMRLAIDHLLNNKYLPRTYYLLPHVVMRSNVHLFREIRRPPVEPGLAERPFVQVVEKIIALQTP